MPRRKASGLMLAEERSLSIQANHGGARRLHAVIPVGKLSETETQLLWRVKETPVTAPPSTAPSFPGRRNTSCSALTLVVLYQEGAS